MSVTQSNSQSANFMTEIMKIPVLSSGVQLKLMIAVRLWQDWPEADGPVPPIVKLKGERARERMVTSNLRLVVTLANKYRAVPGSGFSCEDLFQEGCIGLMTAIGKYDPKRGYAFSTYAHWWIRQSMTRYLTNFSRTIRLPQGVSQLQRRIASMKEADASAGVRRDEDPDRIAGELGVAPSAVSTAMNAHAIQPFSLDCDWASKGADFVPGTLDHGSSRGIWEIIAAPVEDEDDELEQEAQTKRLAYVVDLMKGLPALQRKAIEGVAFEKMTHKEIAERLGLSTTRVGQLYRLGVEYLQLVAGLDQASNGAVCSADAATINTVMPASAGLNRICYKHRPVTVAGEKGYVNLIN